MKNGSARTFFLAFLVLLATSCEQLDELDNTIAEGQVIDATTNQPIPFAEVELYGMYMKASFPAFDSYTIGAKADAEGKFSLSFNAEEGFNYALFGSRNNYYGKYYTVKEVFIKNGGRNSNLQLLLHPYAWVRVNLINDPPKETAEIRWQQYHNPILLHTWIADDATWLLQIDANKPVNIEYWMAKNGGPQNSHSQPVMVAAFDTLEMEIRY